MQGSPGVASTEGGIGLGDWRQPARRGEQWFLAAAAREAGRRFLRGWRSELPEYRQRWGRAFGLWFLASLLVTALTAYVARGLISPGVEQWETAVLTAMETQNWLSFNSALWLEGPANGFVLWGVVTVAALVSGWNGRPLTAASLFFGFGCLYINIFSGWFLWERERPTLIAEGIASPGMLSGFPSGHVAQAIFVYGLLAFLWLRHSKRGWERVFGVALVAGIVVVVGLARLRLGAHWPSDLAGGSIVGGFWLAGVTHSLSRVR